MHALKTLFTLRMLHFNLVHLGTRMFMVLRAIGKS